MPVYGSARYATTVYGGEVQFVIGPTDRSALIRVTSLDIRQVLNRRGDTAQFVLIDTTNALSFAPLTTVTIKDTAGNTKFAGLVTILKRSTPSALAVEWDLTAQDWSYYLTKTLANKKYQGQGVDAIVKDLLASYPTAGPITTTSTSVQSPLPSLAYFNANHLTLEQAFDKLVQMSASTAFLMWHVDAAKVLHVYDQNHVPQADVVLTDAAPGAGQANYRRDTFWYQEDASQLSTSVTFRGGTYTSPSYTQTWVGDGQAAGFPFDYPPDTTTQAGGGLPTVTVAGVAQSVGQDTSSGFGSNQCLVSVAQDTGQATLRFPAAPANGATIVATYVYDVPVLVRRTSAVDVAAYGTWEEYVTDSAVQTQQAAIQRAGAVLSEFSKPVATAQVDVDYRYVGALAAGQQVQLINSQLGINAQMVVTDCEISGVEGGYLAHRLTLAAFG